MGAGSGVVRAVGSGLGVMIVDVGSIARSGVSSSFTCVVSVTPSFGFVVIFMVPGISLTSSGLEI